MKDPASSLNFSSSNQSSNFSLHYIFELVLGLFFFNARKILSVFPSVGLRLRETQYLQD